MYFVEGRSWFVADGTEVMVGAVPERSIDMEQLADALDARYTVEPRGHPRHLGLGAQVEHVEQ
ncbi:hypothetical protein [Kocuria sabuli]|uniref:hypothetical protein n=1 Tax=Kocuria sabuli TaxID=3071448 RepID=UPI0034D52000